MEIPFVQMALGTDMLLNLATEYVEGYRKNASENDANEVYFRVADFLKFVEARLYRNTKDAMDGYEKLKATAQQAGGVKDDNR